MKHRIVILMAAFAAFPGFAADRTASELAPHYEMWETYGGREVRKPRRLAANTFKRTPRRNQPLAPAETVGLRWQNCRFLVNRKTGQPESFVLDGSRELAVNDAVKYPFWTLTFLDSAGAERKLYPFDAEFLGAETTGNTLKLSWRHDLALVEVTVAFPNRREAAFGIRAKNRTGMRLFTVDFPRLSFNPPGRSENCMAVIPWRRGRLLPLADLATARVQAYPGSSARFQLVALYDGVGRKDGLCFYCDDARALDKTFTETYIPAYEVMNFSLRSYPRKRGIAGNDAATEFVTRVVLFDGDWYDAAQIYRNWWRKQKYASRGPVWKNPDVPDFLKRAPLWLRFYIREKTGYLPKHMLEIGKKWHEFLPDTVFPATHYHYAQYPDQYEKTAPAEYYGFRAPMYPGLGEVLAQLRRMNIRTNVYLQSEIINQHDKRNALLAKSAALDEKGEKRLYFGGWQLCCRMDDTWIKRYLELADYLLDNGFDGLYMDTFGKRRVGKECFAPTHGHDVGGGNANDQRKMGRVVRDHVKARSRDMFIGGEACCEFSVDHLDYKLNATNGYNDMIPLERAIYGDYIISHGRVIRGKDMLTDARLICLDFIEGIIPGRFFYHPPADPQGRRFIRNVVELTGQAADYNRFGKLLRPLRFAVEPEKLTFTAEGKLNTAAWHNNVFRSCRDGSVGVVVAALDPGNRRNALRITPAVRREWALPDDAAIYRVHPDGRREKIAAWKQCESIPVELNGCDIAFFIIR